MPMITTGFLPVDMATIAPNKQFVSRVFSVVVNKADGTTEDRVPETEYPVEATAAAPFHLDEGEVATRSQKRKKKSGLVGPATSDTYTLPDTTQPDAPEGFGETTVSDDQPEEPPKVETAETAPPEQTATTEQAAT